MSSSSSTGITVRTTNGKVTNAIASATAMRVLATSTPNGLRGPYRDSRTRPATIVGSANGMSITTLRTPRPGNLSRTSTQAITVPITAFSSATPKATPTVSPMALSVWGAVSAAQKASGPPETAVPTTTASGIRTSRLNQTTATPSPRPAAGPSEREDRPRVPEDRPRVPEDRPRASGAVRVWVMTCRGRPAAR